MVPFIQLFGLYVVAHGHYSPGGGFQGGVILGASLILLAMAYDMEFVQRFLTMKNMLSFASLGVLIFAGWGLVPVFLGASLFRIIQHGHKFCLVLVKKWHVHIVC